MIRTLVLLVVTAGVLCGCDLVKLPAALAVMQHGERFLDGYCIDPE